MKKKIECLSCRFNEFKEIWFNTEFSKRRDIFRCTNCGLAFVWPQPGLEELSAFYQKTFSLQYQSYGKKSIFANFFSLFSNQFLELKIKSRKKFLVDNNIDVAGKLVLEIGSANGKFLHYLKKMQAEVYGIEPSEKEQIQSQKLYNIKPIAKDVESIDNKFKECFDVVFLYHVLEHLPFPLDMLKRISKLLKPGGYVIGGVPFTPVNVEKLDRPIKQSVFNNLHLFHFNIASIDSIFKQANYRMLNLERVELKSCLTRINPVINAHYIHPSFERSWPTRFLSALSAAELITRGRLLGLNAIDKINNFGEKDWVGPNDWIRFIAKNNNNE